MPIWLGIRCKRANLLHSVMLMLCNLPLPILLLLATLYGNRSSSHQTFQKWLLLNIGCKSFTSIFGEGQKRSVMSFTAPLYFCFWINLSRLLCVCGLLCLFFFWNMPWALVGELQLWFCWLTCLKKTFISTYVFSRSAATLSQFLVLFVSRNL